MILRIDPTPSIRARRGEVAMALPVFAALVRGPSMAPTLRSGDAVLVRRTPRVRPGDVVVARFAARPQLLVVKRATRQLADGWWVEGDNPAVIDDSRAYGPADVLGRVILRYWPRPRRIRRGPTTR
jgi:phage repressor protein C with HTH and peptisase S24 domain